MSTAGGSSAPSRVSSGKDGGRKDDEDATSVDSWSSGDGVNSDADDGDAPSTAPSSYRGDGAAHEGHADVGDCQESSGWQAPSPSNARRDQRDHHDAYATESLRPELLPLSSPPPPRPPRSPDGTSSFIGKVGGGMRADSGYQSRSPTSREQSDVGVTMRVRIERSSGRPHTADAAPPPARTLCRDRAKTAAAPRSQQFAEFADARSRSVSTDARSARLSTIHAPAWESCEPTASSRDGSAMARDRRQADAGHGDQATVAVMTAASVSSSAAITRQTSRRKTERMETSKPPPRLFLSQRMRESTAALARAAEEWQKKMTVAAEKTPRKKRVASQRSYRTAALIKQASLAQVQASVRGTALKLDERASRSLGGVGDAGSPRPWIVDRASAFRHRRPNAHVEIHYEKCLPDSKWIECKPKTFVTNHKYGNAYEVRVNRKTRAANPGLSFLWENDCQVWLLEKRSQAQLQAQHRRSGLLRKKGRNADEAAAEASIVSALAPQTVRTPRSAAAASKSRAATATAFWKLSDGQTGSGPMTSDVFEKFDSWAKDSRRRRVATLLIQTYVRRWLITKFIRHLKVMALEKHGVEYVQLAKDYKNLLRRIQRRLGVKKPSAPFGLKEFKQFMERKEAYELAFVDVTQDTGGTLPKKNLLKFFNACKFYPLEREVSLAFDQVFKGCGTQADVVILLDCSASVGKVAYDFQLNFVRDLSRHLDLGHDKIRLAVVPYNDNVFGVIGFDSYEKASDLDPLLEQLTYEQALAHGTITRTDVALRYLVDTMEAASKLSTVNREGSKVPKICITFTDGNCYYTQLTSHWAEKAKAELAVNMFAIAVGKAPEMDELQKIASSPGNVLDLYDYKTLHLIKSAIIGQACLRGCPLCQFSQQQREGDGLGAAGRCADERRGLYKTEALELLWMLYPPPAAGLKKYRPSTWMGAMVESNDVVRLTKLRPGDADFRTCLRKAVEDQIARFGELTLPSETGLLANKCTSVDEAFDCIDRLCFSKLPSTGLTNAADEETWSTLRDRSLMSQARE